MFKLSAVYAPSLPSEIEFDIALRGPLEEVINYMKTLGYGGIEINTHDPSKVDTKTLKKLLEVNNMQVSAISAGLSSLVYGYDLSSPSDRSRNRAIKYLYRYIDLSVDLDCRKVILGITKSSQDKSRAKERFLDSLSKLAEYAEARDVTLLLEPLNSYETNLINKVCDAIEIIEKLKFKNIKITLDTYHAVLEEKNVYDAIDVAAPYLGHVHFAENNRLAPGLGMLDWERIIFRLIRNKYRGFLTIEARTVPDYKQMLKISMETLKPLLI